MFFLEYLSLNVMRLVLFLVLSLSAAAGVAQTVLRGPVISAVTDSSARAILQFDRATEARLEASTNNGFTGKTIKTKTLQADANGHYFLTFDLKGLKPDTKYFVRVVSNNTILPTA